MKKVFGLIGNPLDHSWSPSYFQQQFQLQGLAKYSYHLFPIEKPDDLFLLLKQTPELCGLNVTIPFKETIIPLLDVIDERAKEIGAVNTILIQGSAPDQRLTGYNTDYVGFTNSADFSGHTSALILGTGGASKAIAFALKQMGIGYTLVSRSGAIKQVLSYDDLDEEIISKHTLIINASPMGMYPNQEDPPPIPYHLISSNHFLYDLVYNPKETLFLKNGMMQGARVQSGLRMLHLQAERALKLFLNP